MNRSTRTIVVLAIALLTASAASYGVYRAVRSIPVREVEVASSYTVVAATSIPVGTMLTKDLVKVVPWPSANQVPGSFSAIEPVVNRGLIQPIGENEPVTESKLAPVGAGAGLPPTIPPGMRAISVKVNEVIGVAGFVVPGSRVDLLVTVKEPNSQSGLTRAVVSNVQVLTAGTRFDQEKARADGQAIPASVVTLLATPDDAERIPLAATEGNLMPTLRNPLDTLPTETKGVRLANLMGAPTLPPVEKVIRGRKVMVAPPPPPAPKPYTVEAIRGQKRSEEPVRGTGGGNQE